MRKMFEKIHWRSGSVSWLMLGFWVLFFSTLTATVVWQVMLRKEKAMLAEILPIRQANSKYKYIDPLLAYQLPESINMQAEVSLEKSLQDLVKKKLGEHQADKISVYYRSLTTGRWVGIEENEQYAPASLLKVVIMVAVFKQSETEPEIMSRSVTYTEALDKKNGAVVYQTPSSLEIGKSYSVEQLVEYLVVHSDNGAKNVLLEVVNPTILSETYTDLGIANPEDLESEYLISAKTYSLFLRVLYNSTYLSRENSERALSLLSQADFRQGLVGGVPQEIRISHKFGEAVLPRNQGGLNTALHDCGIVYKPNSSYILCVMTQGDTPSHLTSVIQDISRLVYDSVK